MAHRKTYRCEQCGYETYDYEGRGFMGQHIVMVSCPDCKSVEPLVVGGIIGQVAASFNGLTGRLCLRCGSNRITLWDHKRCPKCGGTMRFTGEQTFWT
jgi:Zn finger protein HypA/HybF involved in hydrogenase expression